MNEGELLFIAQHDYKKVFLLFTGIFKHLALLLPSAEPMNGRLVNRKYADK